MITEEMIYIGFYLALLGLPILHVYNAWLRPIKVIEPEVTYRAWLAINRRLK